jgi:hypothetical protein
MGEKNVHVALQSTIFLSGDIGGTAGLFVGASFLSIIELLYFVVAKSVFGCIGACKKSKVAPAAS